MGVSAFVERLLHRGEPRESKRTDVPAVLAEKTEFPQPRTIDVETDPLRLYPGRTEYVAAWNIHVTSEEGLALYRGLYHIDARIEDVQVRISPLQGELNMLTQERIQEEEGYGRVKTNWSIPRKQKYTPVKRARRVERKKREELQAVLAEERVLEQARQDQEGTLRSFHEAWALAGDKDRVVFYALDNFVDDPKARGKFFLSFVERAEQTVDGAIDTLRGLMYRYASIEEYVFAREKDPDLWGVADKEARDVWYRKHPNVSQPLRGRSGREVFPGQLRTQRPYTELTQRLPYEFQWLVTPNDKPITVRGDREVARILRQMEIEQLAALHMTKLQPYDLWRWLAVIDEEELQNAQRIEEAGAFYGWKIVPRGRQWELLLHKEEDRIVFHLRRLPEEMER